MQKLQFFCLVVYIIKDMENFLGFIIFSKKHIKLLGET